MLTADHIKYQYQMYVSGQKLHNGLFDEDLETILKMPRTQILDRCLKFTNAFPEMIEVRNATVQEKERLRSYQKHVVQYSKKEDKMHISIIFCGAELCTFEILRILGHAIQRMPKEAEESKEVYICPTQGAWLRHDENAIFFAVGAILGLKSLSRVLKQFNTKEKEDFLIQSMWNTGIHFRYLKSYYNFEMQYCKKDQKRFKQIQLDTNQLWRYEELFAI